MWVSECKIRVISRNVTLKGHSTFISFGVMIRLSIVQVPKTECKNATSWRHGNSIIIPRAFIVIDRMWFNKGFDWFHHSVKAPIAHFRTDNVYNYDTHSTNILKGTKTNVPLVQSIKNDRKLPSVAGWGREKHGQRSKGCSGRHLATPKYADNKVANQYHDQPHGRSSVINVASE